MAISERKEKGLFLVEGERQIQRAIASGWQIETLVTSPASKKRGGILLSEDLFQKLSFRGRADDLIAIVKEKPLTWDFKIDHPLIAVVDGLDKPGNLGAIFRSADGAGVDFILIAGRGVDCYNRNVVCASTGALFSVPFMQDSLEAVQSWLLGHQIPIFIADPSGGLPYQTLSFKGPCAMVFGREECGLDPSWTPIATQKLSIPMLGICDSLNVSVSAALLFYEARRQRNL